MTFNTPLQKEGKISIDDWLNDLLLILKQDYGCFNWTIQSLQVNFSDYFDRGFTPSNAAKAEFGENIDEKKYRISHKKNKHSSN